MSGTRIYASSSGHVTAGRNCASRLRPGGLLYLTTPNMGSLSRRVLGADWSVISRDHVSLHTSRALVALCGKAGREAAPILA